MESVVEESIAENPDRQGNDVDEIISNEQLTTYREEETRVEVAEPGVLLSFKKLSTPLPSQQLGHILSRSYDLADATWSSSLPQHTNLTTFSFPEDLWTAPQIKKEIDYYRFFRCKGVRFSLRANTTKFHYGALAVTNLRCGFKNTNQHNAVEPVQRLHNDAVVCSASNAGVVTMDIEWACPVDWIPIRPVPSYGFEAHIAKVFVDVLTPLYSASDVAPPNCYVSFFANFIEPEVSGMYPISLTSSGAVSIKGSGLIKTLKWSRPVPTESPTTRTRITATGKGKKAAVKAKKESHKKSDEGVLTEFTGDLVGAAQNVGKVVDIGSSIVSKLGPAMAMVMDKPTSVESTTRYRVDTGQSLPSGDGLDDVVSLSIKPFVPVDGAKGLIGPGDPSGDIQEIMSKPGYFFYDSFNSSDSSGTVVATWNVNPWEWAITSSIAGAVAPTYLQWYSSVFTYWRGSINYTIFFNTSPLVSTRVRITWLPEFHFVGVQGPSVGQFSGDVVSEVVDVTGDTWHSFSVPFIHSVPFRFNPQTLQDFNVTAPPTSRDSNSNGSIIIEVVNPIVGPENITNRVFFHVWHNAGPDFQVHRYRGPPHGASPNYTIEYAVTASVNDKARETHSIISSTGARADPGYIAPEEIHDLASLLKRYECVPDTKVQSLIRPWDTSLQNYTTYIPENMLFGTSNYGSVATPLQALSPSMWLRAPWLLWRGSLRYRIYARYVDAPQSMALYADSHREFAARGMSINTSEPIQAVELPWNQPVRAMLTTGFTPRQLVPGNQVPFINPNSMGVEFTQVNNGTFQRPTVMSSFGDDIQLGLLYAPPVLNIFTGDSDPAEDVKVVKKFSKTDDSA